MEIVSCTISLASLCPSFVVCPPKWDISASGGVGQNHCDPSGWPAHRAQAQHKAPAPGRAAQERRVQRYKAKSPQRCRTPSWDPKIQRYNKLAATCGSCAFLTPAPSSFRRATTENYFTTLSLVKAISGRLALPFLQVPNIRTVNSVYLPHNHN